MKIGVIISSNDAETCWNALRFANFALGQQDSVKVSLTGKGVEYEQVSTDKFNTVEQAGKLLQGNGKLYACGICIKSRGKAETAFCPLSTMKDMYEIVKESDRVVTFEAAPLCHTCADRGGGWGCVAHSRWKTSSDSPGSG